MARNPDRARARWSWLILAVMSWAVLGAQAPPPPPVPPGPPGPPPTGTGMIAGRVVDADSGQGIPGVTVQFALMRPVGAGMMRTGYQPVSTDSQGRFAFSMLPAGQFTATVDSPFIATTGGANYYSQSFAMRVVDIANGSQATDVVIRLFKVNSIAGIVRDDAGDPVVGAEVIAFSRVGLQGRPPVFSARSRSRTNDRGEYRLVNLPAGQYWVCACSRDVVPFDGQLLTTLAARPLDLLSIARRAAVAGGNAADLDTTLRTYAPTFFPNTPLASRAERVTVEKGETKQAVDIIVTPVRALRVSGQVIGLPPSTISANSLRLVPAGDLPEAATITTLPPMLVQPDGRFDFAGVPPGTYTLELHAVAGRAANAPSGAALAFLGSRTGPPPPPPPPLPAMTTALPPEDLRFASTTVAVGDDDVTGLVVPAQPGLIIRGKVEFSGSAALPSTERGPLMQLMTMEYRANRPSNYATPIGQDMTFNFVVPPGRYAFAGLPSFAPAWLNVKSITTKGVSILDSSFTVESDIPDLVITLTDAPRASLVGTAELPSGEIPEEWTVLIFPSDRRLWKEPAAAYRRFTIARLTAQRTFTPFLPPGDYLLALNKGLREDWMEESLLEEWAKGATPVTLVEGDKKSVTVKR
jgi:hypothetical protein